MPESLAPLTTAGVDDADDAGFDPFAGPAIERLVATTEAQREVWLADRQGREASLAFNESVSLRLQGALDADALHAALQALVARHAALRATPGPDGGEWLIEPPLALALPRQDLRALAPAARDAHLAQACAEAVETPFDLGQAPLLRCALYVLDDDTHLLLMTAHHLVCDGWSWAVIVEDLGALYAEALGEAPSPDAPDDLADYVAWERQEADSGASEAHRRFWLERFSGGALPVLELPTDRPRPPVRGFASRRVDHELPAALVDGVRRVGAAAGGSLFAALLSGFAATLRRLTGQGDLVIGVPAAGQSASGLHHLVTHAVNLLPLRLAVEPAQPFSALVRATGSAMLDAFEHQAFTYGTLLAHLPLQRDPSRLPLVSVMFNVDAAVRPEWLCFPGLVARLDANPRHYENFELFLNLAALPGGAMRIECQYNTGLFDDATVRRWLRSYEALLASARVDAGAAVGGLAWLAGADRAALQALQPPVAAPDPRDDGARMHAAFERQAAAAPSRIAASDDHAEWTYAELDARANQLAHELHARGIGPGDRVGLCVARGLEMLAALLGVLKAGATYVPLDPDFPPARLAYYAEDARLALLVTQSTIAQAPRAWRDDAASRVLSLDTDAGWRARPTDALPAGAPRAGAEDAAYVIYTSGSTGKPKGVAVPHRAVANFLETMADQPGIGPDDRLAAVTTLSFDIAVLELLLPLTVGAETVIVARDTVVDGLALRALLEAREATAMQATPGLWRMLVDAGWTGAPGFRALVGGESFPPDLAHALLRRCAEVWNMYGPTETTVWSTCWRVRADGLAAHGMSIGRPIAHTSVWVLDDARQPCPVGVPGEICIGGRGVALGYLDRPELTADRFIDDPFTGVPGGRLYRTGDRGRWRDDGLLEHLGRLDFQVKVRGYRIELGEIEAGCDAFDGVVESVVVAREDTPGDVRLVAYLVARPGVAVDEAALRDHLRVRLPAYMLPQHVVVLDALPRLPNGKTDRKALPAPTVSDAAAGHVAPRTDTERLVVQAMEAVLKLPGVGVTDDFFALGGHSLLAARLTAQLGRDAGLQLPMRTLFDAPTAERLAAAIDAMRQHATAPARAPIVARPERRSAPLTPMQERIRFVEELRPGSVMYNTPSAHLLTGPLDVERFRAAFDAVVARQPALRTGLRRRSDGTGWVQWIAERVEVAMPLEDLSALPEAERLPEALRRMEAIVDEPMDLCAAPLLRVALYRLGADRHAFLFMPHHLVFDGWSFDVLYDEMNAAYGALVEGRPNALPLPAASFGDYAEWYADWLAGPEHAQQLAWWKQRFADAPLPKAPRPDHPRRGSMTGRGATEAVEIDAAATERLRELARGAGLTLNMLMMALYTAMVAEAVDSEHIVVAVPVRGRPMAEVEATMGFFNNLLPLPLRVDRRQPMLALGGAVKDGMLDAFAHQELPFEHIAREPEVARRAQRVGVYQALFSFQDARERVTAWGPLADRPLPLFQKGATEDLGLWLRDVPGGMDGGFTYNLDLYTPETARAFRSRFLALVEGLLRQPGASVEALVRQPDDPAWQRLRRLAGEGGGDGEVRAGGTAAAPAPADTAPLDAHGRLVAAVWAPLLGVSPQELPPDAGFFDLGGTSLSAMRAVELIEQQTGRRLPTALFARNPSVRTLARALAGEDMPSPVVPLREGGDEPPLFLVHDGEGETLLYRNLALRLRPGRPVYGLAPAATPHCALVHASRSEMVEHYLGAIRAVQPQGPYFLGGLCAGGTLAYEVAVRLEQAGESVGMVALLDANHPTAPQRRGRIAQQRLDRLRDAMAGATLAQSLGRMAKKTYTAGRYEITARLDWLATARKAQKLRQWAADGGDEAATGAPVEALRFSQLYATVRNDLRPDSRLQAPILLARATAGNGEQADEPFIAQYADPSFGWQERAQGGLEVVDVPGGHTSMLQQPNVDALAARLQASLDRVGTAVTG